LCVCDHSPAPQAERYGHPYERPVRASAVPPPAVERALATYLRHALRGAARRRRWAWGDVHALNGGLDWGPWAQDALSDQSVPS
jgi:hypothetical protein